MKPVSLMPTVGSRGLAVLAGILALAGASALCLVLAADAALGADRSEADLACWLLGIDELDELLGPDCFVLPGDSGPPATPGLTRQGPIGTPVA